MNTEPDLLARTRIVLARTQHPGNIGMAARAMMNMGLSQLVLVAPDRYDAASGHPQARAQASGALEVLERARVVATLEEAVADCAWVVGASARPRHLGDEPLTPWAMAERAGALPATASVAIMFGNERSGLSNEELLRCHAAAIVPANPYYSSLNLAQAVQIFAYELRKAALPEAPRVSLKRDHPLYAPPSAADMERFYEHLERALLQTGFLDPTNPRALMRRLRTLFNRAQPDSNELAMLRGVVSTMEKPKERRIGTKKPAA
ncbi:MAG: RNA methyltransferase [Gammaproteobacteria bacterium]|nr:RNA methyltransferase [Gammaproteobacteria bacterium]